MKAISFKIFLYSLVLGPVLVLVACASSPPKDVNNICEIFDQKSRWHKKVKKAAKRWDGDIAQIMAFIHQESKFDGKAKPPRKKILWLIPGPRKSDARGFAQAKKSTWQWYQKSSGNTGADRDNFYDAADFVAWYNLQSRKQLKLKKTDDFSLYLAYHEGHGGFARRSYYKKDWLRKVASKVSNRAALYRKQLKKCGG